MSLRYRNNHYVPQWYQKKFIPPNVQDKELFYLDLYPEKISYPNGKVVTKRSVKKQGLKYCFSEEDLYTRTFGTSELTDIEQKFFGPIDENGLKAIEFFSNFELKKMRPQYFKDMMLFLSTQKLRTPKGLEWLAYHINVRERNEILHRMLALRRMYCAIWTECIWSIADASQSATKFIISDHPVTVYNRECGPRSTWCRGCNDPDIRLHGTHSIFPLSSDKLLILTNLSWVRNPYQSALGVRPNPYLFRDAIFNFLDIQVGRMLNEDEVRQINFIIKSRAYRYLASCNEEWLYPERYVSKSDWNIYGYGYLLMPDPRSVHLSGEILIGYDDGRSDAFDEYGHKPWNKGYTDKDRFKKESKTLYWFKGEFAKLFGPVRRGRNFELGQLASEKDDEELHQYHLSLQKKSYTDQNRKRVKRGKRRHR